jgi:hypothetical protein
MDRLLPPVGQSAKTLPHARMSELGQKLPYTGATVHGRFRGKSGRNWQLSLMAACSHNQTFCIALSPASDDLCVPDQ